MIKSEERTIDGKRYIFTQYMMDKGLEIFAEITRIAAEPLALFAPYAVDKDREMPDDLYSSIAKAFMSNIAPKEFVRLSKELIAGTNIITENQNRAVNFNADFAGDYVHLLNVLKEMLQFQFGNVFQKLVGIIPATTASTSTARKVKAQ
jgi:hypothetical protein